MIDVRQLVAAVDQIAEEKGIDRADILSTIEAAIAAAYKKECGLKGHELKVKFDIKKGITNIFEEKTVVADDQPRQIEGEEIKFNPKKEITLKEAKKIKKTAKVGDTIKLPMKKSVEYGRIAAQTAKQVIIQKIRETERETIYAEYKDREGELVSGTIQRIERGTVFVDLAKTIAVLPPAEQVPNERYRAGERMRFLLLKIEKGARGPLIVLSRTRPELLINLFAIEVPEISSGAVEIKAVAREPGIRSKLAVAANEEGVDPIGACVGQKGSRVATIIHELNGENIDIITWAKEAKVFIGHALSPAKVIDVTLYKKEKRAVVEVAEDQFSLAIGKNGQNVRLAAKLTGWKIDIKSEEDKTQSASSDDSKKKKASKQDKKE